MLKLIFDKFFPYRKFRVELEQLRTLCLQLFHEKHDMIMEDRKKIDVMMNLYHEKHEMILEDREKINEMMSLFHEKHEMVLEDYTYINKIMTLFHEKHEMIMEDRERIYEMMHLFHEKHEMILQDREQINKMMALFHEKHEMILSDRSDIKYLLRSVILNYYNNIKTTEEQQQALYWIKNNTVQMYPYDFYFEYMNKRSIEIQMDSDGWKYILYCNKRLFFPTEFSDDKIRQYFLLLTMEQDSRSPHCYFDANYNYVDNNILIDVGAAEGLIALLNIEAAKKVYLIECENYWCEALKKTFQPYMDKVTIVHKMASSNISGDSITLKELIEPEECYTIKIDVEGNELDVLNSLNGTTLKANSQIVVCAYHNQQDEQLISSFFALNQIKFTHTPGYLLSDWGGYQEPYLRRGLLRGYLYHDTLVNK